MSDETRAQTALWIVQGSDVSSGKLRQTLAERQIHEVQQVAKDTVVLRMTPGSAELLKAEFPELIIEADQDLHH